MFRQNEEIVEWFLAQEPLAEGRPCHIADAPTTAPSIPALGTFAFKVMMPFDVCHCFKGDVCSLTQ